MVGTGGGSAQVRSSSGNGQNGGSKARAIGRDWIITQLPSSLIDPCILLRSVYLLMVKFEERTGPCPGAGSARLSLHPLDVALAHLQGDTGWTLELGILIVAPSS